MIEITHKDLLGRITKFRTKTGIVETPIFLPVVHPTRVLIPPRTMFSEFNCKAIITNAYLLSKAANEGVLHEILDYPGVIMTDSGAYQLLIYGDVEITPDQIIEFQEKIESDIAVILDVPTGGHSTYEEASKTVDETLRRAKASSSLRTRKDILWVGPIQGGTYPDLVAKSAKEVSKLDFSIFAIGSPTQLMEQYHFDKLVELVMTAKRNIPHNKPVHLFGAGHPLIFPLIVAMGCDMFDSAAYALFARHDRLLTPTGTYRLQEIHEQFCTCPSCSKFTISEIKRLEKNARIRVLAEHNLRICQNEIVRIKQAIREGRLWRLVESRISSHPAMVDAMQKMISYPKIFEQLSPVTKKRAIFITSKWSLFQPEIYRHNNRISEYSPPKTNRKELLLFSAPSNRPYHFSMEYKRFRALYLQMNSCTSISIDILFLCPYLGLVPLELTNTYPLAQNEIPKSFQIEDSSHLLKQLFRYIQHNQQYSNVYGLFQPNTYWRTFSNRCRKKFEKIGKTCLFFQTDFTTESLKTIVEKIG
ncbi:MAG: tRNA guanosine(15) transglycosylase TgtA [Candidatus Thorarchaeota archaeon]